MRNPTDIKQCISEEKTEKNKRKETRYEVYLLKISVPVKAVIKVIYNKLS